MNQIILFEKSLSRVYFFLRLIGLEIDYEDGKRSFIERLRRRRTFCVHFLELNLNLSGEVLWLADSFINGTRTLEEYTNLLPGLTLAILGNLKSCYMIKYAHHVIDLIQSYKKQYANMITSYDMQKEIKTKFVFLTATNRFLVLVLVFGVSMFAVGPIIKIGTTYFSTGEIELQLPFIVLFPFDAFQFPMWPIIYLGQTWAAIVATIFFYGPDSFYYTSCMFIHIQFNHLQHDMKEFIARHSKDLENRQDQSQYSDFVKLVNRHRELIRCVDLLEIIFSKSTLYNVVSSSLIICVTGFNIMVIKDLTLVVAFTFFLTVGFVQICLFCYYGEIIIESSSQVADAIYDSKWYECSVPNMKNYLFILKRARKPCKLTAYGFSVIGLNSFGKILSTSWSYFALLLTLYGRSQGPPY